jgi:hypothetical protein
MRQTSGAVILYVIRSVLLWWFAWPAATLIWLGRLPYALATDRRPRLRQIAGWLDLNLISFLQAGVLRPFFAERLPRVPWRDTKELMSPASSMGPLRGEFRQQDGTTLG